MEGRSGTAPCGHPGEAVIGTYYRCLTGCDAVAKKTATPPRRGLAGHVEMCACKPCQIHRRVTHIVLRSYDGKDLATIEWDGVSSYVTWKATKSGRIRHWRMFDADGPVVVEVASGMLDADQLEGWQMRCDLHWLMSP